MEKQFAQLDSGTENDECRRVHLHFSLLDGLQLNAEVVQKGKVLAARNESIRGLHKDVSTDFPVSQSDGSIKWYEEYPTHTDPITGRTLLQHNDLYRIDPQNSKVKDRVDPQSDEYTKANGTLSQLRAKYTPEVILTMKPCN